MANRVKDALGSMPEISIECSGAESAIQLAIYVRMRISDSDSDSILYRYISLYMCILYTLHYPTLHYPTRDVCRYSLHSASSFLDGLRGHL